jgi:hypothetical protein
MKYEQWRNQSQQISKEAQELLKKGKPTFLVKFLIACGLAYEAWHSHSLYHRGLGGYSLYESWAWYAAWIPVILMTGSSVELLRAPHKWLKSEDQRAFAFAFSWCLVVVYALNVIADHWVNATGQSPLWVRYYAFGALPGVVIAVFACWKRIWDLRPEQLQRIEELQRQEELRKLWQQVDDKRHTAVINSMLQAFDRTEVQQGIEQLTNNAAVVFSAEIVDALNPERQTHVSLNSKPGSSGHTIGHNGQVINGQDREDGRPH